MTQGEKPKTEGETRGQGGDVACRVYDVTVWESLEL